MAGGGPPITMAQTLAFALIEARAGTVVFEGTPTDAMLNPAGLVHGGWAATILDSALGCAVHSVLTPGEAHTTLEIKVNYTRPIRPGDGPLTATGTLIHKGRRTATSEARLVNAAGKVVAHGSTTCLVFPASPFPASMKSPVPEGVAAPTR